MTTQVPDWLVRRIQRRKIWNAVGYVPHDQQAVLHDAIDNGAKRVLAVAGRRGGKSEFATTELVTEMGFPPPKGHLPIRSCLIAAPEADITENIFGMCWNWIVDMKLFGVLPSSKSVRERFIEMPWKSRLEGKTTKDPKSLRGPGRVITVADEFAFGKDVMKDYLIPPLIDTDGLFIAVTTPDGDNFCKDYYDDWTLRMKGNVPEAPPRLYCTHTWTSWDNPYLPRHVLEEIKAMYLATGSDEIYAQEILAQFTAMAGAVYPMFNKATHVSPQVEYDPELPVTLGVDWGFVNPACVLFGQRDGNDVFRIFDEIYVSGLTAAKLAEEVIARFEYWGIDYTDDNQYNVAYCDPSGAAEREEFDEHGIWTTAGTAEGSQLNSVKQGIAVVRQQFGRKDRPGIVINPRCRNLIRYIPKYVISQSTSGSDPRDDKPRKKDDHGPDALRMYIYGELGSDGASFASLYERLEEEVAEMV